MKLLCLVFLFCVYCSLSCTLDPLASLRNPVKVYLPEGRQGTKGQVSAMVRNRKSPKDYKCIAIDVGGYGIGSQKNSDEDGLPLEEVNLGFSNAMVSTSSISSENGFLKFTTEIPMLVGYQNEMARRKITVFGVTPTTNNAQDCEGQKLERFLIQD